MALEVYWGSGSPYAWRVLLGLEVKQIPYESKRLSFSEEDLKSAEFLAISPRGKVPAIRDGDFTLHESIAILRYLEDKQPEPPLFGRNATERGKVWCSIMETVSYLEAPSFGFIGPIFSGQLAEKQNDIIQARETVEKELDRINQKLTQTSYLVGDHLSAADIVLYPSVKFIARIAAREDVAEVSGGLRDISTHYPSLSVWCEKIEALPGYERTYPPHWKES